MSAKRKKSTPWTHFELSMWKSVYRIIGGLFIVGFGIQGQPRQILTAGVFFIIAEVLGIWEELV